MFNYSGKVKVLSRGTKTIGKVVRVIKYFKEFISENYFDVKESIIQQRELNAKAKLINKKLAYLLKDLRNLILIVFASICIIIISIVLWFLI